MPSKLSRREFLTDTVAATAAVAGTNLLPGTLFAENGRRGVAIILNAEDAKQPSAKWAAAELRSALSSRSIAAQVFEGLELAPADFDCVIAAIASSNSGKQALAAASISLPNVPEALGLAHGKVGNRSVLFVCGADVRGLVYALLELTDRVNLAANPIDELRAIRPTIDKPANRVRSLSRCFVSDVEDKPWFNDHEMWSQYLATLATQRFNRFNLSLGIGYDFLRNVTDAYFLFAYPFFLSVPGYNVRVPELPDAQRDRNLEMLRFISEQTVARGLEFHLGLWMHGYEWLDSPKPNYTIAGLSRETHGPYCRDAVRALLQACPAISGITFRTHGESGVAEGSYDFWRTVFEGVGRCGRTVELNLHAKGIDQTMIDSALATGMPVTVAPKYWAEHLGMPYHQAEIRELERPKPGREGSGLMKLSSGSRSFLRYGYGDLFKEDRRYGIVFRIWPGTQRLLLWGDPLTAAAHGRAFSFCGCDGVELMEPLTFKGRRGSGIAGDRCGYADASLRTRWDWEKYLYTVRIWGRHMYSPDTDAEVWRRTLRKSFGKGAPAVEIALANATRILPIVTTAHLPSAANNTYWPEMYANQSLIEPRLGLAYGDTPSPKVFGNVSPLDPQLILRINDFASELLKGQRSGKYTPIEVAQWIEDYADAADKHLATAENRVVNKTSPEYRRMAVDLKIQIGLGRFFGAKLRSGVLYALYEQSGDPAALAEAVKAYRRSRDAWAGLANAARGVYQSDVTVGELRELRGHWLDRLPAIDADIAAMEKKLQQTDTGSTVSVAADVRRQVTKHIQETVGRPHRENIAAQHSPPAAFRPGQPLELELLLPKAATLVCLYYRHVNQGERFQMVPMQAERNRSHAAIPSTYTDSPYPLQYYFEIQLASANPSLYPGFGPDLANQPYFVVRQR